MLRRYNLVRALLIAGVVLGYGGGLFSLAHHHRHGHGHHCGERSAPEAPREAPPEAR